MQSLSGRGQTLNDTSARPVSSKQRTYARILQLHRRCSVACVRRNQDDATITTETYDGPYTCDLQSASERVYYATDHATWRRTRVTATRLTSNETKTLTMRLCQLLPDVTYLHRVIVEYRHALTINYPTALSAVTRSK